MINKGEIRLPVLALSTATVGKIASLKSSNAFDRHEIGLRAVHTTSTDRSGFRSERDIAQVREVDLEMNGGLKSTKGVVIGKKRRGWRKCASRTTDIQCVGLEKQRRFFFSSCSLFASKKEGRCQC